jgi:hypothetical protein
VTSDTPEERRARGTANLRPSPWSAVKHGLCSLHQRGVLPCTDASCPRMGGRDDCEFRMEVGAACGLVVQFQEAYVGEHASLNPDPNELGMLGDEALLAAIVEVGAAWFCRVGLFRGTVDGKTHTLVLDTQPASKFWSYCLVTRDRIRERRIAYQKARAGGVIDPSRLARMLTGAIDDDHEHD